MRLTRAELLLDNGDAQAALVDLLEVRDRSARYPHVLGLLQRAWLELEDWPSLAELLPQLRKRKVLPEPVLQALELQVYSEMLRAAAGEDSRQELERAWAGCPDPLRRSSELLQVYAPLLLAASAEEEAEKLVVATLKKQWVPSLVELYGRIPGADPARQLKQAESWRKNHADDATLLLCLGRLSLRNKLWGQARDFFESSLALEATPETCAELARLLFRLGEREKSAQYYRQGLTLAETSLPDLPLPDSNKRLASAGQGR